MPSPLLPLVRLGAAALLAAQAAAACEPPGVATPILPTHPGPDWRTAWRDQRIPFTAASRYTLVARADADGLADPGPEHPRALRAESDDAASGLLHPLRVPDPRAVNLQWTWRVNAPLGHPGERTRSGDDYVARVLVVFETSAIPTRTRSINYVWSASEPVGSVYPGPYGGRVAVVVVRSATADAGRWIAETRDVLADYRAYFEREPEVVNAVAVMADTDDTDARAVAWFADIVLCTEPGPVEVE